MPAKLNPGPVKEIVNGLKRLKGKPSGVGIDGLIQEAMAEIDRLRREGYTRSEIAQALRDGGAPYSQSYLSSVISKLVPRSKRSDKPRSPRKRLQSSALEESRSESQTLERSGRLQGSIDHEEY